MVHPAIIPVKITTARFADAPWDRSSPQWIDIDRRLPHDDLARLIDEAVERLDLQPLLQSYAGRGSQPYHPALLLRIVLYQLACGVHQPARWARHCRLHDELKWLAFGIAPSRSRLYQFRERLGDHLDAWFQQIIAQAAARGITTAARAALDGSTIAANASRHRLLRRGTLDQRLALLAQAVEADGDAPVSRASASQTGAPGAAVAAPRPWWMAKTPRGRRRQLARYQEARAALGRRIAENARRKAERRRDPEKIVIAPADPTATPGRDKLEVFRPLYNAQVAYDLDSEMILAADVFAQQNDTGTLPTLLTVYTTWVGHAPAVLLADAGYATVIDATACAAAGVVLYAPYQTNDYSARGASPSATKTATAAARLLPKERFTWDAARNVYVCPSGKVMPQESSRQERRAGEQTVVRHVYRCAEVHCQACPLRATCTPNPAAGRTVSRVEGEEVIEALRARMETAEAKVLYKRRRSTVERGYADLKVHRQLDRFTVRGLARVRVQFRLQCLVHNLLVVARHARARNEEQEQKRAAG